MPMLIANRFICPKHKQFSPFQRASPSHFAWRQSSWAGRDQQKINTAITYIWPCGHLDSSVGIASSKRAGKSSNRTRRDLWMTGHFSRQWNEALAKPSTQEGSSRPALALAPGSCPSYGICINGSSAGFRTQRQLFVCVCVCVAVIARNYLLWI